KDAVWRGRQAVELSNDSVSLVILTGGGHVAKSRFHESTGLSTANPLWVPPWKTIEPFVTARGYIRGPMARWLRESCFRASRATASAWIISAFLQKRRPGMGCRCTARPRMPVRTKLVNG